MSLFCPFYASPGFDKEKPLLMYGFGMQGVAFLRAMLAEKVNIIIAIFDANPEYHKTTIRGIPVLSPERISDYDRNCNIFISTIGYQYTITKLFREYGFSHFYYEHYPGEVRAMEVHYANRENYNQIFKQQEKKISSARLLFSEQKSIDTYDAYFNAYGLGKWDEYESCMSKVDWKRDGIFHFGENNTEVYYDCGA
jgi:FlaA1/EpsC-like NDP-sugar epimerase